MATTAPIVIGGAGDRPREQLRSLEDLPGPRGIPWLGSALDIDVDRAAEVFETWATKYKPLGAVRFPKGTLLLVTEPSLTEGLLRARPDAVRRWSNIEVVFAEMGAAGVFSLEGDAWKAQRKLVVEALSPRHIRGFFPTLRLVAQRLLGRWRQAARQGRTLDPVTELMHFTTDVTVSLAFGMDMNSLERGEDALQKHLSLLFPAIGRRLTALVPYWRYVLLPRDRQLNRALTAIRQLQHELVSAARQRLSERASGGQDVTPNDMLEAMLLARDEEGRPYSEQAIHGNMLTMLLGGEDTTAYGLAWAMHYLCDRPDVLERMRREATEQLGDAAIPETYEAAGALPYIDAVAEEALRLRSPALELTLEAREDLVVGDVFVPRGTPIQAMTRLPALEDRHFADAASFRPERWVGEVPGGGAHEPRVNMPFGSGPRICAGRALAQLEMRLVLALIAQAFDLERVGSREDVRERTAFVMRPSGLLVRLVNRS